MFNMLQLVRGIATNGMADLRSNFFGLKPQNQNTMTTLKDVEIYLDKQMIRGIEQITPKILGEIMLGFAKEREKIISSNPLVSGSVCCHSTLIKFKTYGYDECSECGKTYKQTDR